MFRFTIIAFVLFPIFLSAWKPPLPSFYEFEEKFTEQRSAKVKFDDIWRMMTTNGDQLPPYSDLFNFLKYLNLLPLIPGMNLAAIQSKSMFRPWRLDRKMLHTQPAHASIKLIFNEEAHRTYTGLFESDSVDYGIMSLSPGFKIPNITNFFALSIRSFRDNVPASAVIAAFNFISQPNWNVFDYMVCTHYNWLMAIPLVLLGPTRMGQGWTQYFNQFGLSNLAEFKVNGESVQNPRFPWALCFIPDATLREKFKGKKASHSAIELMQGVEAGDKLYDIWAIKEPYPLANPSLLKEYSHHIGELRTTSEFITSTYAAQRLLGTHQRFEEDLKLRPDWIAFASPFYLMRAGAVGVYAPLFDETEPDLVQAQLNLMLLMTGIVKAFTTVPGFRKFILQFGITPSQLYKSTVHYLLHFVLPMRLNPLTRSSISPPFKLSAQWAINTIQNIALYVGRVGVHPPLGPLQLSELGHRHSEQAGEAVRFVESQNCISTSSGASSDELNNQSDLSYCVKRSESDELTVQNTLFRDVRSLPFHIDVFNGLIHTAIGH